MLLLLLLLPMFLLIIAVLVVLGSSGRLHGANVTLTGVVRCACLPGSSEENVSAGDVQGCKYEGTVSEEKSD